MLDKTKTIPNLQSMQLKTEQSKELCNPVPVWTDKIGTEPEDGAAYPSKSWIQQ